MEPKSFMESLQQRTLQGKAKKMAEMEAWQLENRRIAERTAKIKELLKTDPKQAAPLLLEEVLEYVGRMADRGEVFTNWNSGDVDETLQDNIIFKLEELGLMVKVDCGHGHSQDIKCRGRSSYNCWPRVMIWWRVA